MKSNVTIDITNTTHFFETISVLDPEYYIIRVALTETGLNPLVLPEIIRSLANLAIGTGHGKVSVYMSNRIVTQVRCEESAVVNESAVRLDKPQP